MFENRFDKIHTLDSGQTSSFGLATSPASFCQLLPQLDPVFYPALAQSLYIRITNDKFNPMNSLPEHMVYGITSTSADTDHLNDRFFLSCIR